MAIIPVEFRLIRMIWKTNKTRGVRRGCTLLVQNDLVSLSFPIPRTTPSLTTNMVCAIRSKNHCHLVACRGPVRPSSNQSLCVATRVRTCGARDGSMNFRFTGPRSIRVFWLTVGHKHVAEVVVFLERDCCEEERDQGQEDHGRSPHDNWSQTCRFPVPPNLAGCPTCQSAAEKDRDSRTECEPE